VQLIESYEPCICLSYVWGGYTASKETPNIGSQLPVQIPKTIKDAIQVANRLGIPLLWVDQYCFDQNDISMRTATIESMDLIHGAAAITIIVASGADASSGLPDVRGTTRKRQNILIRNQMEHSRLDLPRRSIVCPYLDVYRLAGLLPMQKGHCVEEPSHGL
jgi:hypothetical protein